MKKIVAFLCAAVLTLGTMVTAFASPSPQVKGIVTRIAGAVDRSGKAVSITLKSEADVASEYSSVVAALKTEAGLKGALGNAYNENMTVADVKEISVPSDTDFPVTITFSMTGVTASSVVYVLVYTENGWKLIETTAGDGEVTAVFDSLPSNALIAFVVDSTTVSAGTSPKTGETNAFAWGVVVAVVAFGGMVVTYSRRKRA